MDETLETWAQRLCERLGVQQALDVDSVLKLAADAAHGVKRPAAPLTTFLAGVAIGQSGADPERTAEILATIAEALESWPQPA